MPPWAGDPHPGSFPLNDHKPCGYQHWITNGAFGYHCVPTGLGGVHDTALAFRSGAPPPAPDWRLAAGESENAYETDLSPDPLTWDTRFATGGERHPPYLLPTQPARDTRLYHFMQAP